MAQFKAVHGADSGPGVICTAVNACFGPKVKNDESGATYEFGNVSVDAGIVDAYTQNFVPGTTIDEAKAEVLKWLPKDTIVTSFAIDHKGGSCAQWNLASATLGKELGAPRIGDPQGVLGVTFEYINANLRITYDPNNVQDASISDLPDSPTDSC